MAEPGRMLSHYRLVEKIGEGGMGVVWKAEDSVLGRTVAVKVLPADVTLDAERRRMFLDEARLAASVAHGNIVQVHELGREGDVDFIVMEYVEGKPLSRLLHGRPLPPDKVAEWGLQVAQGLARAHRKGLLHRDLKPANILVTRDGEAKIVDFGLATLFSRADATATLTASLTDARHGSTIAGTLPYMSPEQVRGEKLDARSDIFSFGIVLYEMTTGQRPFSGPTTAELAQEIQKAQLRPVHELVPKVPLDLRRIVEKALARRPEDRYQGMDDAAVDLNRLRKDLESGSSPSYEDLRLSARRRRGSWILVGGLAVLAAGLVGLVIATTRWLRGATRPADRSEWVQITNLPDSATQPALSPDGRMLTFLRGPNTFVGAAEIYVKMLPDGEPVQITHDGTRKMSPVFSPDGSRIAYTVTGDRSNSWDTWTVPVLGGTPQLWLPNAEGLSWIDRQRLLFSEIKKGLHMAIVTSLESRAESRDVYVPADEDGMAHRSSISPDGKWVLVVEMDEKAIWMPCRLVPFDGRTPGRQVGPRGARCTFAAWSPDSKWMYMSCIRPGDVYHLWRQRFPRGRPEQITSGPTEEEGLAVSPDGRSLISAVALRQRPISLHDASGDHQVSLEGYAYGPRLYAAGRKVCYGVGMGRTELWLGDLDSGRNEPLLPGFLALSYDVSRDGRLLVGASDADGKPRLWLARLDRRSPPRPVPGIESSRGRFGPAGRILFVATEGGTQFLFSALEDGTGRRKVASEPVYSIAAVSPDGRWVAGLGPLPGHEAGFITYAYSTTGAPRIPLCNIPSVAQWAPDGKFMYFGIYAGWMSSGAGRTYVLPTWRGSPFPDLPAGGFQSEQQLAAVPGVRVIEAVDVNPGPSPDVYVFSRETVQRNLYRIPLR